MSPTCAISPPGISIPANSAPRASPAPSWAQTSGSARSVRTKSSIAIGSAPTQITSLAFIATQSIPIVSYRPSLWATTILVPTVSVDIASPAPSSIRSTLA